MILRTALKLFLALGLCGCAGQTFMPDVAPEFLVIPESTPLYRYGPQQAGAPEARIPRGERVRMLRKEFGYSLVLMSGGMTGYVANMDLAPAAPLPTPRAELAEPPEREEPAPLPPVEATLPKPDLDVTPADAPAR